MAQNQNRFDLSDLRRLVAADPGSPEFPALAEAERRGGDPERAREIAAAGLDAVPERLAGRVALGLALLDLGQDEAARQTLSTILDASLEPHQLTIVVAGEGNAEAIASLTEIVAEVGDDELDVAFAVAEPEVDEMLSPNRMAEQVLLDRALVDDDDEVGQAGDESFLEEVQATPAGPAFRTATMAELLARQGDEAGAEAIRRELDRTNESLESVTPVDAATVPDVAPMATHADRAESSSLSASEVAARRARILATLEGWLQNIQRGRA